MARLLAEKGSSLIRAFESLLRTGLRSQVGIRLQVLLEEMSNNKDILFIAVTMPDGTILSHSNPTRLGEILQRDGQEMSPVDMEALNMGEAPQWRVFNMEGVRAFVVFQHFSPIPTVVPSGLPQPNIFLGLDVSPFEIARSRNRTQTIISASGIVLLGFACLLVLYYAQRARESRRKQRAAEGQIRVLEEEVRRRERLAAVGTLAAGVAHEIRNPLSSIKGYATYFGRLFEEGSENREAAHVMVREVDRLNRVITDLIGFSRPTDVRLQATSLKDVVDHCVHLLRQDAENRGVHIHVQVPADFPLAYIDPDRLEQAILNLCLNAIDAMPDGGMMSIRLEVLQRHLLLTIHDTGVGIAPESLAQIFTPYFTTKGRGTGLGLAIVYKIVEAHGGEISCASRQATEQIHGETTFSIYLPKSPPEKE